MTLGQVLEDSIREEVVKMTAPMFALPRLPDSKRSSHSFKEQRRQTIEARILRKASASASATDTNVKPSEGRGNWNRVSGITFRRKPTRVTEQQKQEEKENAGKNPVLSNSLKNTAPAGCKTVSTSNLCAPSIEKNQPLAEITPRISLSQSYLRKKKITEKQLQEKINSCKIPVVCSERELHPDDRLPKKPVLGAYRGKVVQSKISSFRKLAEDKPISYRAESSVSKSSTKPQVFCSMAASTGKMVQSKVKSMPADSDTALNKAQHTSAPKRPQNLTKGHNIASKVNMLVNERLVVEVPRVTMTKSHVKTKTSNTFTSNTFRTTILSTSEKPQSRTMVQRGTFTNGSGFQNQPKQPANAGTCNFKTNPSSRLLNGCSDLPNKEKIPSAVTVRRNTRAPSEMKCRFTDQSSCSPGVKSSQLLKTVPVSSRTVSAPFHNKTMPEIQAAVSSRFVLPKETAEERRARLTQWQASKGKVMKRPPMVKPKMAPLDVQKEAAVSFPECIMDGLQKLSIKGADDTSPKCSEPEQQIDEPQRVSNGQDLESRICETEETNNNNEITSEEPSFKNEGTESDEKDVNIVEVHKGKEKSSKKHKYNLREACRKASYEKDGLELEQSPQSMTPESEFDGASVIRINVRTTPSLKSISKNMHEHMGDSAFKELKFLTPVRRSVRIERKACKLPEMLQDHDPCLVSLGELPELEDEKNAYIFRANNALHNLAKDVDCMKTN